ncbi:MAG: DUF1653 domain-containing protein [Alphaproteobacteria bacterium]|nr:MAG: hypothetical protein B6I23_03535 [Rickettsiaceae bacterium 4572_127]
MKINNELFLWGQYKHYKGHSCVVIGEAMHSETLEELVIYTHDGKLWCRPKKMFLENIEIDGKIIPRFQFIETKNHMPKGKANENLL